MVAILIGFIALAVVEVSSLAVLAQSIGTMNTISWIMFTFLVGIIIGRSYSKEWTDKIQWHLRSRTLAPEEVLNGAVMVVGSALLITPGFITDVIGLVITFPKTRFIAKKVARSLMQKKIAAGEGYFFFKES